MKFAQIEPEVAGGFGENSQLDNSVHPPAVKHFHHEFYGWLGDDLLETVANFIVTDRLWQAISKSELSGVKRGDVEVSFSEEFEEFSTLDELPRFIWLKVEGIAGDSDFGMSSEHILVVSKRALKVLREFSINHCDIEPYSG